MDSDPECDQHGARSAAEPDPGTSGAHLLACRDNAEEWPLLGGSGGPPCPSSPSPGVPALRSCAEVKFALLDRLPAFTEPDLHTDLRRGQRAAATVPLWSPGYARDMDAWQREVLHRQRLGDQRPEFSR